MHLQLSVDLTQNVSGKTKWLIIIDCLFLLFFPVDETGKIVHDENGEMSMDPGMSENDDPSKEDSAEVIKVYIFKADSGEDDLGKGWPITNNQLKHITLWTRLQV